MYVMCTQVTMRHQRRLCICLGLALLWIGPLTLITQTNIVEYFMSDRPAVINPSPEMIPTAETVVRKVTSPTGDITSLLQPSAHEVVPNVVHYVWFGEHEPLRFHHYLSIRSAYLFIKPDRIMFHCDYQPTGKWWADIKRTVPTLEVINREPPAQIFGNEVILAEHKSDVARMQILMEHGGVYLDTDVLALKPFAALRRYRFTMGLEYHGSPGRLNNGVIVAAKEAEFLRLWHDTYRDFTKREWDYHDSIVPYRLQFDHPRLIHVEEKTLNWPSGRNLSLIYDAVYDWRDNYAVHLWYRLHEVDHNPHDIRRMNTTFGQISRLIYYGSPDLL